MGNQDGKLWEGNGRDREGDKKIKRKGRRHRTRERQTKPPRHTKKTQRRPLGTHTEGQKTECL